MRLLIFKTVLVLTDGVEALISIAASEINDIPALVERNKAFYTTPSRTIERFYVTDTLITLNLSNEQYEEELMYCDIIMDTPTSIAP